MSPTAQLTIAILTALTPTVAVFLGVLIQWQDSRDLRTEMGTLRKDMQSEIANLRRDMQSDMLSLRNQVHADMLLIHERVAKGEARQGQSHLATKIRWNPSAA